MHLVGVKQNADVDRRENRNIDMKETGKASMLECQKCIARKLASEMSLGNESQTQNCLQHERRNIGKKQH